MTQVIISIISVGLPILAAQVVIIINAINDNKHKDALIIELQAKVEQLEEALKQCKSAMVATMHDFVATKYEEILAHANLAKGEQYVQKSLS